MYVENKCHVATNVVICAIMVIASAHKKFKSLVDVVLKKLKQFVEDKLFV